MPTGCLLVLVGVLGTVVVQGLARVVQFIHTRIADTQPDDGLTERDVARFYAGKRISNLELAYEEAKFVFEEQVERIGSLTTRATWLVASAATIVGLVATQAKTLTELPLDGWGVVGLGSGALIEIAAAILGIIGALPLDYKSGITIESIRRKYIFWEPKWARLAWLRQWQDMFEHNERVLVVRARILVIGLGFLLFGVLVLALSISRLVWLKLTPAPVYF